MLKKLNVLLLGAPKKYMKMYAFSYIFYGAFYTSYRNFCSAKTPRKYRKCMHFHIFSRADDNWCSYMYHNNFQNILFVYSCACPYLSYDGLLNKTWDYYFMLKNNCIKLQTKIINYMMLLDTLVTQHMISDLVPIFKEFIFDVILIV